MPGTAAEILDNHLRALQTVHQVDVPSSDQHTVKPWFQGKTDFSPPVPDLTKDDFILKEDGKEQPIRYFSVGSDLPLTLALLVDVSGSQRTFIGDEWRASGSRQHATSSRIHA